MGVVVRQPRVTATHDFSKVIHYVFVFTVVGKL